MKLSYLATAATFTVLGMVSTRALQTTPRPTVVCYDALSNAILALHSTEEEFVRAMLDGHHQAARAAKEQGKQEQAAAEMAFFGNEGDNAIGGIRKKLLEGGFNHNAAGEASGIFDPGFVLVTKKVKDGCLAASAAMRAAKDDAARKKAWTDFTTLAEPLLAQE